ncbi:MAG: carboxypeptidase regulatory-like domain-containing protein [Gemmatimonadota bacterium]
MPAQERGAAKPGPGAIEGTVRGPDGAPVARAWVYLSGTHREARTDSAGGFRFDAVPPGRYALEVQHPDPLLEPVTGPADAVQVVSGGVARVTLAFSPIQAAAQLCGVVSSDSGQAVPRGTLVGRVRDAPSGGPARGAVVWIRRSPSGDGESPGRGGEAGGGRTPEPRSGRGRDRSPRSLEQAVRSARATAYLPPVMADSTGSFVACGVPVGVPLLVQATAEGRAGALRTLQLPAEGFLLREFTVSGQRVAGAFPEATVVGGAGVTLRGIVRAAESADPVSGARVRLLGTDLTRVTGKDGTFVIPGLRPGRQRVVTDYLGMSSDTVTVDLTADPVISVSLRLQTRPVELPDLRVEVERTYRNPRVAEFYRRMDRGIGDFITHEQLERGDVVSAIRRLPSVRVQNCVVEGLRDGSCWTLRLTRGTGIGQAECRVAIYVNGARVSEDDFTYIVRLPRDLIEGIEVYRGSVGQPAHYRGVDTGCGLVLVWLKGR